MTNPVGPSIPSVAITPLKKVDMQSVPKVLFRSIFQHLDAKDLQNTEGVCKSWQTFTEDPHVWKFIREKLKISGTKKEVLSYINDTLPEINKILIGVLPEEFTKELLSVKHPFEQFVAIENFLRTNLKDTLKEHVNVKTNGFMDPLSQTQGRALQILIDYGANPLETICPELV